MGAPSGAKGELHLLALSLFCRGYCCRNLRSASWLSKIRFRLWPRARLTAWLGCLPRWRRGGRWSSRRTSNACRESACRLQIAAHVIEWYGDWRVACRTMGDPVTQSLSDARTLLRTDALPAGAAARAVPLFCRLAMEARARTHSAAGGSGAVSRTPTPTKC